MIFTSRKNNQLFFTENIFPQEMATQNKRKLAASNKENCEEHPRSNLAQNSNVPRSQEDYMTQVSEEIEGRVTKKLSQKFSSTENRTLGALARPNDFLMNPLIQGHSGIAPETSRKAFSTNQRTNEDDSQSDPHPEAGIFGNQTMRNSGAEEGHDMASEEIHNRLEMATGVTKETRRRLDTLRLFFWMPGVLTRTGRQTNWLEEKLQDEFFDIFPEWRKIFINGHEGMTEIFKKRILCQFTRQTEHPFYMGRSEVKKWLNLMYASLETRYKKLASHGTSIN